MKGFESGEVRSGGFTLLEVIISLTIMAMLAVVVFSSLRLALNSYEMSQIRLDKQARERVLLDEVRRQIGSLFPMRPSMGPPSMEAGEPDQLTQMALTQVPLFYGQNDFVTFITVAPLQIHQTPGLTVVRYGLAQDEYGDFYLGAMESIYTGLESFSAMVATPAGKPLPVVEGIERLEFEYYGYDSDSESYFWTSYWDGEEAQSLPSAVRIHYNDRTVTAVVNATFSGSQYGSAIRNLLRR